jgi:hypothetical protein
VRTDNVWHAECEDATGKKQEQQQKAIQQAKDRLHDAGAD